MRESVCGGGGRALPGGGSRGGVTGKVSRQRSIRALVCMGAA